MGTPKKNKAANKDKTGHSLVSDNNLVQKPKLADFFGKLKGFFGDGLEYQKKIREEWDR